MANAPVVRVRFDLRDRDGDIGQVTMYLPYSSSLQDVDTLAAGFIQYAMPLSNAVLSGYSASWTTHLDSNTEASIVSDVSRQLFLFSSAQGGTIERIAIASPRLDIFEQVGRYAGIRVNLNHPDILDFEAVMTQWLTDNDGFPLVRIIAGGLVR